MTKPSNSLTVDTYTGDAKVLLAFNLDEKDTLNLAGFTINVQPDHMPSYYLFNQLQFAEPEKHAQVATESLSSTANSPIQKFRWLHVPGNIHNKDNVFFGTYTYVVTPRYFADGKMLPIDAKVSITVKTDIRPFSKNGIETGFTRGFTQSQAFVNHFGKQALFKPKDAQLVFDTSQQAGTNDGKSFTYADEYRWSGFTAREKVFGLLNEVKNDPTLFLDVLAYDLNEPDVLAIFLQLASEGRIRIALDNAALHHTSTGETAEDKFAVEFDKADSKPGGQSSMKRGHFSRFQHNKILIVSKGKERQPVRVLTGSTNFSVTGMYVNSNHVMVFNDSQIVGLYQNAFETMWNDDLKSVKFRDSDLSKNTHSFTVEGIPVSCTFAPHSDEVAEVNLDKMKDRIAAEKSSVLFAVMGTDPKSTGPIPAALTALHQRDDIFSAGITDSTSNLTFYKPSSKEGVLVTGLPGGTILPPPFCEEKTIGMGHQVHHKFIVCGFNTPDAVVWLGSSNLALGGEQENGDNLIEIHDTDIATVFALEALALVDHFHFRNKHEAPKSKSTVPKAPNYTLNLGTTDAWSKSYYDKGDLHCVERELFGR